MALTGAGFLALGVLALLLALPRLAGGLLHLPGVQAYPQLTAAGVPDRGAIDIIVGSHGRSLAWVDDPAVGHVLGQAHMARSRIVRMDGGNDQAVYERAARRFEQVLVLAPAKSYTWAHLARANLRLPERQARSAKAYGMSVLTNPRDLSLILYRLQTGFGAWPVMDDEIRALVRQDIRIGFSRNPVAVAGVAGSGLARGVVRGTLASDVPALLRFDNILRRLDKNVRRAG